MQFVEGGPDIPADVIAAQEEGRLVFFCGAGVSVRAGLPDFGGLTQRLFDVEGVDRRRTRGPPQYDKELGRLERDVGRAELIARLGEQLKQPESADLSTHEAILELARDPDGEQHVITTNFDLLFESASAAAGREELQVTSAPLLPIPKPRRWRGLVHLHGRLDPKDREGVDLVLTTADFGIAYLLERWASRFVSEIFRHYTVLFVGYSVSDPVMRYLVDAIAADAKRSGHAAGAYALVGHAGRTFVDADAWQDRGIEPIPYRQARGHAALHETLRTWSERMRDGPLPRIRFVRKFGRYPPAALRAHEVAQVCGFLAEKSGAVAREFAKLGATAPAAWLDEFANAGLLGARPAQEEVADVQLVDSVYHAEYRPLLAPVQRALAHWVSKHLAEPATVRWAVASGPYLHPEFRDLIEDVLGSAPEMAQGYRDAWRVLTSPAVRRPRGRWRDAFALLDRIKRGEWSPLTRIALLRQLAPALSVRSPSYSLDALLDPRQYGIQHLIEGECGVLAGDHALLLSRALRESPARGQILRDIAFDLVGFLRQIMDLWAIFWRHIDVSALHVPSVEPDEEERHLHEYAVLIETLRDACGALMATAPDAARTLVACWLAQPHRVFRRLAAYAIRTWECLTPAETLDRIEGTPTEWMWGAIPEREELALLRHIWSAGSNEDRTRLECIVMKGPPTPRAEAT